MNRVNLLFHHAADDFISRGIAWASHAEASHVAMLHPDGGYVLEASAVGYPKGVRIVSVQSWRNRHPGYWMRYIDDPDPMEIWNIAASKEGCGYDLMYFVGWLLRMRLEDPKKLVCQELIDWAFRQAGRPLFDTDKPHFLTPQSLHLKARAYSEGD